MKKVIVVLAAAALLAVGCSVVKPLATCWMQAPVMIAAYPSSDCTGDPLFLEIHDGVPYLSAGEVTGKCLRCVPIHHGWTDKDEWLAARISLGIPLDACATSPAGAMICPPKAERTESWGAVKALYR